MQLEFRDIARLYVAIELASITLCGFYWCFIDACDLLVTYPTRPLIQILYAVNMLPQLLICAVWYNRSRVAGALSVSVALFSTIRVYVTVADSQSLSGQCGLLSNFSTAAFMVYTAFFMKLSKIRKPIAIAYSICLVLLVHYWGRYLQTGTDAAVRFFQVILVGIGLWYTLIAEEEARPDGYLACNWQVEWVNRYSA